MPTIRHLPITFSTFSDRVARMPWLDKPAAKIHALNDPLLGAEGPPAIKNALYGTWLGHPLHPVLTDLPIGFWTSSFVFDLIGMKKSADIMLKLGTLSTAGAAFSGYAQWHDLQNMEGPKRIGALHAMLNGAATVSYIASWILRDRDKRAAGIVASTAGIALATAGGMLGGDLSYKLGIGVNRVAFAQPSSDWTAVAPVVDLEEGKLTRVESESGALLLFREGDAILATSATCTHVGAPLDEGEVNGACVVCPWHGSEFDLRDGRVVQGPATSPLHAFETRIENDQVEIRLKTA